MEVLDAGSGANPYPRATVLCDLHVRPTIHRDGKPAKLDERPFVCCDLQYLPFKSKVFDYVYSWHVLEHTNNPDLVLTELKRVGQRGMVAAPSRIWQFLFPNNPTHQWVIQEKGGHRPLQHNTAIARLISLVWRTNWRIKLRERFRIERVGVRTNIHDQVIRW